MLNYTLIVTGLIILTCIFLNKVSSKFGVPVLLLFLLLGVLLGWTDMESDIYVPFVEKVCTTALIFIMFYGGFGTKWKSARPVIAEAGLLASLGVFATAALVGVFCHFVLHWGWVEGLLMGSVISSTDAASVFSILRTRKMGLKNNTAPMLEIESGSNDPCSYMLTAVMIELLNTDMSAGRMIWMIFSQLAFGIGIGLLIAQGASFILRRYKLPNGFDMMFIMSVAILAYAIPQSIGGNGYLSAYIVGIVLGNTRFEGRKPLVNFFDGVTSFSQILIFYMLGYICHPTNLPKVFLASLAIFGFITLVARPLAISSILLPFRKYPVRQIGLISFVGLRGAASIVFAIMTLGEGIHLENSIFDIVFCIVLMSIALQGSLIPAVAKATKMIDDDSDVLKTFSDYTETTDLVFGKTSVNAGSEWSGKAVMDLKLPADVKLILIIRGAERIIPKGDTIVKDGDVVIFCSKSYYESHDILREHPVRANSKWIGKKISEHPNPNGKHVVMIKRGDTQIIPNGDTVIEPGDVMVIISV